MGYFKRISCFELKIFSIVQKPRGGSKCANSDDGVTGPVGPVGGSGAPHFSSHHWFSLRT